MALEAEGDKLVTWIRYIKIARDAVDGMEYVPLAEKYSLSRQHVGQLTKKVLDLAAGSGSAPMIDYCRESPKYWHRQIDRIEGHVYAKLKEIGLVPG